MNNLLIRESAKNRGIRLWRVAEELGMQDSAFSRMLRHELPPEEQARIVAVVEKLDGGGAL